MSRRLINLALILCTVSFPALPEEAASSGHYLFAWAGDVAQVGNDFLAVIDADFYFDDRQWPHGWKGSANPHGVVFSR